MVVGAHGVFHAVLGGCAGQLHGHTRHRAAIGDMFPRFQIMTISDRTGKVHGDVSDGRQRDGFAQDIHAVGHHDFRIVEQRVKALIRRITRRNRPHQFRVHNGENRIEHRIAKTDFFLSFRIGNNAPTVDFRGRSCRKRDRHHRQTGTA